MFTQAHGMPSVNVRQSLAYGIACALYQSLSDNPLQSPYRGKDTNMNLSTAEVTRLIAAQQAMYVEMKYLDLERCPHGNYDFLPYEEEIEGMTYYIPNSDEEYIVVMDHASKQAIETNYYDMDDFLWVATDYIYVMSEGVLMQQFEARKAA